MEALDTMELVGRHHFRCGSHQSDGEYPSILMLNSFSASTSTRTRVWKRFYVSLGPILMLCFWMDHSKILESWSVLEIFCQFYMQILVNVNQKLDKILPNNKIWVNLDEEKTSVHSIVLPKNKRNRLINFK